jgi:hypothetical protein
MAITAQPDGDAPGWTRRRFLAAGTAAGLVALAGCTSGTTTDTGAPASVLGGAGGLTLIPTFDTSPAFGVAGIAQRFPFQLATPDGAPTTAGPDQLELEIRTVPTGGGGSATDGAVLTSVTVPRHHDGVPNAYYPLRFTPATEGTYKVTTTVGGKALEQSFMVGPAQGNPLVQVGQKLVPVETPTPEDHRGVEPICTRQPAACDLHATTLAAQMQTARPVALLVSTPRFCQIGICGPVLELFLAEQAARPHMAMVHAEVYADAVATGNIAGAELAPTVEAYGLTYEPSLFVADAGGTVVERLDYVFDRTEMRQALDKAA